MNQIFHGSVELCVFGVQFGHPRDSHKFGENKFGDGGGGVGGGGSLRKQGLTCCDSSSSCSS